MPAIDTNVRAVISDSLASIIEPLPLPSLAAGPTSVSLRQWLESEPEPLTPLERSGLWLLGGDLDASHEISQSIETPEGSFWHGIMHRREGDFWNAKYWFRRIGRHPVLSQLAKTEYGDGQAFVDRCEAAIASSGPDLVRCQELQWQEWQWLYLHCAPSRPADV